MPTSGGTGCSAEEASSRAHVARHMVLILRVGQQVQSDTVFEVADDVFDDGMAAVVGFHVECRARAVGDQAVVGELDKQGELRAWRGADPAHDQAQ
jgi:hypothetical protein